MFALLGDSATLCSCLMLVSLSLETMLFAMCRCNADVLSTAALLCNFVPILWRQVEDGTCCAPADPSVTPVTKWCCGLRQSLLLHAAVGEHCPGPHTAPEEDHGLLQEARRPLRGEAPAIAALDGPLPVYDLVQSSTPLQGCDERLELVYLAFDRMCNIKEFRCDGLVDGRRMRSCRVPGMDRN